MDLNRKPTLYLFAGLPGSGKTTLAQMLASKLACAFLRIDTIEQALRDLCHIAVEGEGYRLAYRLAVDQLGLRNSVVVDSCNPITLTRREWESVARICEAAWINIEIVCSDLDEHRRRVETRGCTVPGLVLPTWDAVLAREYDRWETPPLRIDTAGETAAESFERLWRALSERMASE